MNNLLHRPLILFIFVINATRKFNCGADTRRSTQMALFFGNVRFYYDLNLD